MIKENQKLLNNMNVISDMLILITSMVISYFVRFTLFYHDVFYIRLHSYLQFMIFLIPINCILYTFFNLYKPMRTTRFFKDCLHLVEINILLIACSFSVLYVFKFVHISRLVIIIFFFVNTSLMVLKRLILRQALYKIRLKGQNLKHILIVGGGETASEYLNVIRDNKNYGYNYVGYVSNSCNFEGKKLGNYNELLNVLNKFKFDEVICALDVDDAKYLENIVSNCEQTGTKISIIPFCYKFIPSQPYIDVIGHLPLINIRRIPLDNMGNAFLKRIMDIIGSLILIILTSPIMIVTALIIKLTSKGPIIFKQERVGLNKKIFTMYKFRSMKVNNEETTGWSTNNDPRKTKFGSLIRKFSIDELPQFFNVLHGDMSLVGPRPELPHFVEEFKDEVPLYMVKHQVKPGITGLAQINGYRGDTSIKKRIEFDIQYIENWNIFLDIIIILKTAFSGFKNNEQIIVKNEQHTLNN